MSKGVITFKSVFRINMRFVFAGGVALLGWGFWALASKEWYFFWVLAYLAWAGAAIMAWQALNALRELIARDREMRALEAEGGKSQGDSLADTNRLRDGGVIR